MMQQISESTATLHRPIPRPLARQRLRVLSAPARTAAAVSADEPHPESPMAPLAVLEGLYTAPFAFILRPLINRGARSVPLVLDDQADLAVVSRSLDLVASEGGFEARIQHVWQVEARVRLSGARAASEIAESLRQHASELLETATRSIPSCARGDAPLSLELLPAAEDGDELRLCLRLETWGDGPEESDLHDAARAIAPLLMRVASVRPCIRIRRKPVERARVSCRIRREKLLASTLSLSDGVPEGAEQAIERAVGALAAGAAAPITRAHNAMIEHAVGAVALALGNAPGRVTRALEQHALRSGRCAPLCTWRARGDVIEGVLELPVEIITHGRWRANDPERDIALLAACIGTTASLIALQDTVRAVTLEQQRSAPPPPRRRLRASPVPVEPSPTAAG